MPLYGPQPPQYAGYGGLEAGLNKAWQGRAANQAPFLPKKRIRTRPVILLFCVVFPWLMFTGLYALMTFNPLGYSLPWTILFVLGLLAGCLVLLGIFLATIKEVLPNNDFFRRMVEMSYTFQPYLVAVELSGWLPFLFVTTAMAAIAAIVLGDINYWANTLPFYELQTMNTYNDVDPSVLQGQQMMDAGRVIFQETSVLDLRKAYQFQDQDTYCVAPITSANSKVQSYDFWAVGLNCCGFNTSKMFEYKCGPYKSSTAKQGLRLMSATQRDYYSLAVQQAEAQWKITANHPLMFFWTEDAKADMQGYWDYGNKYFGAGVGVFFCWQVFALFVYTVLLQYSEFWGSV